MPGSWREICAHIAVRLPDQVLNADEHNYTTRLLAHANKHPAAKLIVNFAGFIAKTANSSLDDPELRLRVNTLLTTDNSGETGSRP